ncbi:hypothetical protein HOA92_04380 [archaeon]|jgi:hypothetical protein|nr:hypothetical protein [archaeon]MBT6762252.1 hypothetical protein [archaeon]
MERRGQVTIFIILGLFLSLIIATVILTNIDLNQEKLDSEQSDIQDSSQNIAPIKLFVESCIEDVTNQAILYIGKHGGYYNLPSESDDYLYLPYFFYISENHLLSIEEIQNQLSLYVNSELFFCTRDYSSFEKQGYHIQTGSITTTTTINQDNINFDINYPISINIEDTTQELSSFNIQTKSSLFVIYQVVEELLREQTEDPKAICLSCVVELAINNDLKVYAAFIENDQVLFRITDNITQINNQDFEFSFINIYNFENEEVEEDESLE